jgi:hypothetical protein
MVQQLFYPRLTIGANIFFNMGSFNKFYYKDTEAMSILKKVITIPLFL